MEAGYAIKDLALRGPQYECVEDLIMPPVILPYLSKELILQQLPVFSNELKLAFMTLAKCDELVVIGSSFFW